MNSENASKMAWLGEKGETLLTFFCGRIFSSCRVETGGGVLAATCDCAGRPAGGHRGRLVGGGRDPWRRRLDATQRCSRRARERGGRRRAFSGAHGCACGRVHVFRPRRRWRAKPQDDRTTNVRGDDHQQRRGRLPAGYLAIDLFALGDVGHRPYLDDRAMREDRAGRKCDVGARSGAHIRGRVAFGAVERQLRGSQGDTQARHLRGDVIVGPRKRDGPRSPGDDAHPRMTRLAARSDSSLPAPASAHAGSTSVSAGRWKPAGKALA